jgi:hypothetical protein
MTFVPFPNFTCDLCTTVSIQRQLHQGDDFAIGQHWEKNTSLLFFSHPTSTSFLPHHLLSLWGYNPRYPQGCTWAEPPGEAQPMILRQAEHDIGRRASQGYMKTLGDQGKSVRIC